MQFSSVFTINSQILYVCCSTIFTFILSIFASFLYFTLDHWFRPLPNSSFCSRAAQSKYISSSSSDIIRVTTRSLCSKHLRPHLLFTLSAHLWKNTLPLMINPQNDWYLFRFSSCLSPFHDSDPYTILTIFYFLTV